MVDSEIIIGTYIPPINLEQKDIKIVNLSWSMSLQCFVKRSMRARVRYERRVSLNVIIIVANI